MGVEQLIPRRLSMAALRVKTRLLCPQDVLMNFLLTFLERLLFERNFYV